MKLTAWRELADMFAGAVNQFPNSKYRLANLEIKPIDKNYAGSSNIPWEATLKRPLSLTLLERAAPVSYAWRHFPPFLITIQTNEGDRCYHDAGSGEGW